MMKNVPELAQKLTLVPKIDQKRGEKTDFNMDKNYIDIDENVKSIDFF